MRTLLMAQNANIEHILGAPTHEEGMPSNYCFITLKILCADKSLWF